MQDNNMQNKVKFFKLYKKFVDENESAPEVKQLQYYALAIGHHVGVVDCLSPVLEMEKEAYLRWIGKLPEGIGRKKLEGLTKWGELEINKHHAAPLAAALSEASSRFLPEEKRWAEQLLQHLQMMIKDPLVYLVVRLW